MFYTVALPQAWHSTLCNDHIISSYACVYIIMHISLSRLFCYLSGLWPFFATVVVFLFLKNETVFFKSWTVLRSLLYWITFLKKSTETRLQTIFSVTWPFFQKKKMWWCLLSAFVSICLCVLLLPCLSSSVSGKVSLYLLERQ